MNKNERAYIAKISKTGVIQIRIGFRTKGFVKIVEPTKEEIKKEFKRQESLIKEELELLNRQKELQDNLDKLRQLRTKRKNGQ